LSGLQAIFGIATSTLSRWRSEHEQADLLEGPHEDVAKEVGRLRKENEILRQGREILKKATAFFAKEGSR
jgi:transposase